MIEAAEVSHYSIQHVAVVVLTVAAFVTTGYGLWLAFTGTQRMAAVVAQNVAMRDRLRRQLTEEFHALEQDTNLTTQEKQAARDAIAIRQAEAEREFDARSPIPLMWDRMPDGSEPIAETLVRDLAEGSRSDLIVAGIGLAIGLMAAIWGVLI